MKKPKQSEASIHAQVCAYIRAAYPSVIFTSEASGLRLTIGQAKKMKALRSSSGLPDLWVMEPQGSYHGLFLELKAEAIQNKKGEWRSDHIKEQAQIRERLADKGYCANFAIGFEDAKRQIDNYMNQNAMERRKYW